MTHERCPDCVQDATHTLAWRRTTNRWQTQRLKRVDVTHRHARYGRYCHWHALCRLVQWNARGIQPEESPHGLA
jgi:hypothetical protein